MNDSKKKLLQTNMNNPKISPKGTNIPGMYRECDDSKCHRLIPCPHVRCQEHRTDMAIKDWNVPHIEP